MFSGEKIDKVETSEMRDTVNRMARARLTLGGIGRIDFPLEEADRIDR
jgi:hypothetical protein